MGQRDLPTLTRRTLLRGIGATGLAAVGAPVLNACSPQAAPQPTGATSPTAQATARQGGRITWAVAAEGSGLDPHLFAQNTGWQYMFRVYEQLLSLDESGRKPIPGIAVSWSQAGATTWTFKLRDNVKFSNGRPLRASDVAKSFQRLFDPVLKSTLGNAYAGPIKDAKAIDEHTVQIELQREYGPFLSGLTSAPTSILPMQELDAKAFDPNKDLLGSGPFVLKETLKGESWTFVRNPHYWRTGLPHADELVMLVVPDQSARLAAVRSGRADVASFDTVDAPRLVADIPNATAVIQATSEYYVLALNEKTPTTPALKDARVRQALGLALDRDQIIRVALGGGGKPAYGTVPGLADDVDSARLPKRDVERAKSLLASAGATGLSIEIITSPVIGQASAIAQVIQRNFSDIGVTARLQDLEQGAWRTRFLGLQGDAQFDATVSFYAGGTDNWHSLNNWSPTAFPGRAKYKAEIPEFKTLLDKTSVMQPGSERQASFQKMAELLASTANTIPLATRFHTIAYRSDRIVVKAHEFEPVGNFARFIAEYSRKD